MAAIPPIEMPVKSALPRVVELLRLAMAAEEIDPATRDRVVNRLLAGDPEGTDAVRLADEVGRPQLTIHFHGQPPPPNLAHQMAVALENRRRRGGPGGMAMTV